MPGPSHVVKEDPAVHGDVNPLCDWHAPRLVRHCKSPNCCYLVHTSRKTSTWHCCRKCQRGEGHGLMRERRLPVADDSPIKDSDAKDSDAKDFDAKDAGSQVPKRRLGIPVALPLPARRRFYQPVREPQSPL